MASELDPTLLLRNRLIRLGSRGGKTVYETDLREIGERFLQTWLEASGGKKVAPDYFPNETFMPAYRAAEVVQDFGVAEDVEDATLVLATTVEDWSPARNIIRKQNIVRKLGLWVANDYTVENATVQPQGVGYYVCRIGVGT
jgi:hypothetical protein